MLAVVAAYAAVYVIWGSTYFAIRVAVETLPPFTMAGVRFLVAGTLLYVAAGWRGPRPSLTRGQWGAAALVGVLMLLGGNGLVCWAEQYIASGLAALLVGTVPLWMVVLDWLLYRGPRPTAIASAGLLIGLVGVWLLVGPEELGGTRPHLGATLALLGACVAWTLGSLYSRRASLPKPTWLAAGMQMLAGGAALLLVGAAAGEWSRISIGAIHARSLVALAYLILFGSLIGLTAYLWLLQVSTPAKAATYAYVNPVIAILIGAALGDEPLTARIGSGAVVIIGAVVLITRLGKRRPDRSPAKEHVQTAPGGIQADARLGR